MEGRVIKAYNSFFYVQTEEGLMSCKLRGSLKRYRRTQSVLPGDVALVERLSDGTGVIESIKERTQLLRRPQVANLTAVVITMAAADPAPHPLLLNRFLVLAEWSGIKKIIICLNKIDLAKDTAFLSDYEKIGYRVIRTSAREGVGLEELKAALAGEVAVLSGPSGAGKSSLLNALMPELGLETGHVSEKIKRGRHTTRVAELIPFGEGFLVDTPGFSAVEFLELAPEDLPPLFPEFREYLGDCRFQPCSHSHEPDCAVKKAAADGAISEERYSAYLTLLAELRENKTR